MWVKSKYIFCSHICYIQFNPTISLRTLKKSKVADSPHIPLNDGVFLYPKKRP